MEIHRSAFESPPAVAVTALRSQASSNSTSDLLSFNPVQMSKALICPNVGPQALDKAKSAVSSSFDASGSFMMSVS